VLELGVGVGDVHVWICSPERGEPHSDMGDRNDSNNRDSGDMCGQSGGGSFLGLELEG